MDASPTTKARTENMAQLRCAIRNNPSSLHAPIDWDANPEDLVDWSTRVVEACVFATCTGALSYQNASCVILEALRNQTANSYLPWEFTFAYLSCSEFKMMENVPELPPAPGLVYNSLEHCPKCGSKATWEQKQTRSADEGCTVFWKCTNVKCRKTWTRY